MPENWKIFKLSDAFEIIGGGTPKTTVDEYWNGNIPWLSVVDFNNDQRTVLNTEKKITQLGLQKSSTKLLKKGQLIISARGTVGQIAQLGRDMAFNQSCYGLTGREELLINDFGYYLLKRSISNIQSNAHGSVFDTITKNTFENIEVQLPPLPEQTAIASILSAIDDKIELNLQMNKTLEEMATALYKHWFVDFGPFREGEFVDSELGRIPKGWEVKRTEDEFSVKDGTHDSPKQKDEGHFLITSKHIKKNEIDISCAYKISSEDFIKVNQRSRVDNGDILMTMIGTVGVFYLVNEAPNYAIKNIGLFKTSEVPELKYYMFLFLNSDYSSQYIKSQLAGSTQQYLTLKVLRSFPFLYPTRDVLNEFNSIVSNYFEMIQNNIIENQTLTTLRDALLPKLISGEVRVKEFAQT